MWSEVLHFQKSAIDIFSSHLFLSNTKKQRNKIRKQKNVREKEKMLGNHALTFFSFQINSSQQQKQPKNKKQKNYRQVQGKWKWW